MKLLEYEAKNILQKHGLPIPKGEVIHGADFQTGLSYPLVIKAQIPKGGRGKAGGIQIAKNYIEANSKTKELLSKPLLGCDVKTLLIEQALDIQREFYLAIILDRSRQSLVLLAHKDGGVDIEQVSGTEPPLRIVLTDEPDEKIVRKLIGYFNLGDQLGQRLKKIVQGLWRTILEEDALLIEVNPLILTKQEELICADAKIELDDAAAFRHDWQFEVRPASTQFVILNEQGTIASMANGAGLAMATIDAIKTAGAEPANFFDVGGGTNVDGMVTAFQKMAKLPQVKAIVVNIFGGITRCDEVAEAIITATRTVKNLPKLFIRLTGTNEIEGRKLLEEMQIITLPALADCVTAATHEVNYV